jgi:hypothetical protein
MRTLDRGFTNKNSIYKELEYIFGLLDFPLEFTFLLSLIVNVSPKTVTVVFKRYLPAQPSSHLQFSSYSLSRYLGLYQDKRLTWNPHTRLKRIVPKRKFGLLRCLMNSSSKLFLNNNYLQSHSQTDVDVWR